MFTINRRGHEPLHIALPDFDKGHRCPGWSGEGMRANKVNWCDDERPAGVQRWALTVRKNAAPPSGVENWVDLPGFYSWRVRRTNCCNTIVMPQFLYFFTPGAWFYVLPGGRRLNGERFGRSVRPGSGWHSLWWQWRKVRRLVERRNA